MRVLRVQQATPVVGLSGVSYSPAISVDGTQYVDSVLAFTGAMTIRLDPTVFHNGTYVLFDYGNGSFPGGQAALANITIDYSNVGGVTGYTLTNDPVNKKVFLTLSGGFAQSIQYVEGNLDFTGVGTIKLDSKLFNGPGEYTILNVTGTISNLQNSSVVPLNTGLRAGLLYTKNGATTGNVYCTLSAVMPTLG